MMRSGGLARLNQFVSCRQDRDARTRAAGQPRASGCCGQGDTPRVEAVAGRQQLFPVLEIAPARANMSRRARHGAYAHLIAASLCVFLDDHPVCSGGQGGARRNPRGLSGPQRAFQSMSRGAFPNDSQCRALCDIDRPDCPTIHGRRCEGRLVTIRCHGLGEPATVCGVERNGFSRQCDDGSQHTEAGLIHRGQAHDRIQSPDAPPDLVHSITPSIVISRSTALSMS